MTEQSQPYVVWDLATGRIVGWGRAAAGDAALQAGPGQGVVMGEGEDASDWVNPATGLMEQRPATGLPGTAIVPVGAEWEIAPVPDGTVVLADGVEVDIVAGGDDLVLQFPISASWSVELLPPFPWRPARCAVTTI